MRIVCNYTLIKKQQEQHTICWFYCFFNIVDRSKLISRDSDYTQHLTIDGQPIPP